MPRPSRTAKYIWRMVADPLICGGGPVLPRLHQCPLPRRGQECVCRFEINEIVDDLIEANAHDVADWFEADIDPDDMGQLIADLQRARAGVHRLVLDQAVQEDLALRFDRWIARVRELEDAGSGLTGRYSDDLED